MTSMETETEELAQELIEGPVYLWPCAFNNFSKLPYEVGKLTKSKPFKIGQYEFQVQIYPGGQNEDCKGYVSIFLCLCEPSKASIKFTQSILLNTEKVSTKGIGPDNNTEIKRGKLVGWPKFEKRSTLLSKVALGNDQLTVLTEFHNINFSISLDYIQRLSGYGKYVNNEEHSDVKIIIGRQTIFAHKVILTCRNEVFTAMFKHDLKESKENVVYIEDIEYNVMLELIRFIYTDQTYNIEKMPKKLLVAADRYGEEQLKAHCGKYLSQLISVHNALDFLNFADQYKVKNLRESAITFFVNYRKDVVKTLDFKSSLEMMDVDSIAEILTNIE